MKYLFIVLLSHFVFIALAQDLSYVLVEREKLSVLQSELASAEVLDDIHPDYKGEWVEKYISTEIKVINNGTIKSVKGENTILSQAQKKLISNAEVGSELMIVVHYIPKNSLKNNTPKEMHYSYQILPATLAEFPGGYEGFDLFVNQNITTKLSPDLREKLKIAKIQFTISEDGSIDNVHFLEGTNDLELNSFLIDTICKMPFWAPAQDLYGNSTKQTLRFLISSTKNSCLLY